MYMGFIRNLIKLGKIQVERLTSDTPDTMETYPILGRYIPGLRLISIGGKPQNVLLLQ